MMSSNQPDLCLTTMVSGNYQWYAPLFVYCCRQAYPEYSCKVIVRGPVEPLPLFTIHHVTENPIELGWALDGLTTAALRFIIGEELLELFPYCLITDVDVLIQRETPTLLNQHLNNMKINGLDCYDNYCGKPNCCPGVHFISHDWWDKTEHARQVASEEFRPHDGCGSVKPFKDMDEQMLYQIITTSPVAKLPMRQNLWETHGLHLGKWRNGRAASINAMESTNIQNLLRDHDFMDIWDMCAKHLPELSDTLKYFKEIGDFDASAEKRL